MSIKLSDDFVLPIDGMCLEMIMSMLQSKTDLLLYVHNGSLHYWQSIEDVPVGGFSRGSTSENPLYFECVPTSDERKTEYEDEMWVCSQEVIDRLCSDVHTA